MTKRLSNKDGSYTRRKDGSYGGQVWLRTSSGELKRFSKYGKTKAIVRLKINELVKAQESNTLTTAKPKMVAQYLSGWWQRDPDLKPSTLRSRELNVRRINEHLGGKLLSKVSARDIRDMLSTIAKKGAGKGGSAATRQQVWVLLKSAMAAAVRDHEIKVSPFAEMEKSERPKVRQRKMRVLTAQEIRSVLSLDDEWTPHWTILLGTGMRRGELLALRWGSVDIEGGRLSITETVEEAPRSLGGYRMGIPKSESSSRQVIFKSEVAAAFRELKERQTIKREAVGDDWAPHDFIFTRTAPHHSITAANASLRASGKKQLASYGYPLQGSDLYKAFQRTLEAVGVDGARVHDTRHTYATHCMMEGQSPKVVQEALGHSHISITLSLYSHAMPGMHDGAADVMNGLLRMGKALEVAV
jgi:integrase